jgi:hypothetical protein
MGQAKFFDIFISIKKVQARENYLIKPNKKRGLLMPLIKLE